MATLNEILTTIQRVVNARLNRNRRGFRRFPHKNSSGSVPPYINYAEGQFFRPRCENLIEISSARFWRIVLFGIEILFFDGRRFTSIINYESESSRWWKRRDFSPFLKINRNSLLRSNIYCIFWVEEYIYVYTYWLHDSILITSRSERNVFENNCFQLYKNCIEISLRLFRLFSPNWILCTACWVEKDVRCGSTY